MNKEENQVNQRCGRDKTDRSRYNNGQYNTQNASPTPHPNPNTKKFNEC